MDICTVRIDLKPRELFTSYGNYLLNTNLSVPSVGFSVPGLDSAKLGVYQFQSFLFIVNYHSNIDFTKTYILTNCSL